MTTTQPAAKAAKTQPAAKAVEVVKTGDSGTVDLTKVLPAKELTAEQIAERASIITKAENDFDGYTLLPVKKVAGNHTVEMVEPPIVLDGKVVVKRKA